MLGHSDQASRHARHGGGHDLPKESDSRSGRGGGDRGDPRLVRRRVR
jgi:hypothetical protein